MKIYIENETSIRFNFRGYKKLIETVAETVAKEKNIPSRLEVCVMLVSEEKIRQINKETRNIDKVTDVLSFPYFEFEEAGVFEGTFFGQEILESQADSSVKAKKINSENENSTENNDFEDMFDIEECETMLGDIVICAEKVEEQAKAYGHSQKRELAFLVVHSMLHLIGYDHMNDTDEKRMMNEAEKIMNILGITREI